MGRFILLVAISVLSGCSSGGSQDGAICPRADFDCHRSVILEGLRPVIEPGPVDVIKIRDWIYRTVPLKETAPDFPFRDFSRAFLLSVSNPDYGHICGGLALTLLQALWALDLPARYVGLFSATEGVIDSHATVDVLIDGQWVAVDPTFNITIRDEDGARLGWFDVASRAQSGLPIFFSDDGYGTLHNRAIEDYYRPLREIAQFAVFGPHAKEGKLIAPSTLPSNWNGQLDRPTGLYDVPREIMNGPHYLLAHSYLREINRR